MLKKIVFAMVVCTCVSVAFGAAVKITDFMIVGEPPGAEAMAILNYAQGQDKTVVQLIISGFTPGTTYEVVFQSGTHDFDAISEIFTDGNGHGTLHTTLLSDPGVTDENGDWSDSDILINLVGDLCALGINTG